MHSTNTRITLAVPVQESIALPIEEALTGAFYLVCFVRHPNSHASVGNNKAPTRDLEGRMNPDGIGRAFESHDDCAEREEQDPCHTAEDGMGDLDRIIIGRHHGTLGDGPTR